MMKKFTAEDARYMQPKNKSKLMLKECLEEISKAAENDYDSCVYNGQPLPYVDGKVDDKDRSVVQLVRELKALGFDVTIRNPGMHNLTYGIAIFWKES